MSFGRVTGEERRKANREEGQSLAGSALGFAENMQRRPDELERGLLDLRKGLEEESIEGRVEVGREARQGVLNLAHINIMGKQGVSPHSSPRWPAADGE